MRWLPSSQTSRNLPTINESRKNSCISVIKGEIFSSNKCLNSSWLKSGRTDICATINNGSRNTGKQLERGPMRRNEDCNCIQHNRRAEHSSGQWTIDPWKEIRKRRYHIRILQDSETLKQNPTPFDSLSNQMPEVIMRRVGNWIYNRKAMSSFITLSLTSKTRAGENIWED